MHKITPFLWFDGKAELAMKFYVSIFKNSKIVRVNRRDKKVFSVTFLLEGQKFIALNGGPHFKFTPAISFFVDCRTQQEVDRLWTRLSKGGNPQRCGWLTDKFGVSWQIIPSILGDLLQDKDDTKAGRVMNAMLGMRKIDIKGLKKAYVN
jgi:predicted 3-demethylubiquinone-9 3-methyltransferase (glyoxalase superfamily)